MKKTRINVEYKVNFFVFHKRNSVSEREETVEE